MNMPGSTKKRLDLLVVERGLAESREQARALILAGAVRVDSRPVDKPGQTFPTSVTISVERRLPFVSRAGLKLAHALRAFGVDVTGLVAVDVGASTGGFTDCLLQAGARKVYAVDVGYGQLDWRLRQDPRVVVMERTNIRYLEKLPERPDIATVDVSFISLRLVLPAVVRILKPGGRIIALIKPQFEAGRQQVGKGGVVRDPAVHRQVLESLAAWLREQGLALQGLAASPIKGPAGNVEFLALIGTEGRGVDAAPLIDRSLEEAAKL